MKRWPTMRLGDLVLPAQQRDPRQNPGEEFCYVDIAGIDNEAKTIIGTKRIVGADAPSRARKVIRMGDVIVSTVRPNLNAVALVPDNLDNQICSTGFSVLRPSSKVTSGYLFAFVRSPSFIDRLVARTTGANYPAVNDGEVKDVPIPVPPLAEQERIVKLLDEADELRKQRTQADRRTTALIPSLFREMFGGSRDWPVERLEKLCERITVGHVGPMATEYCETGVPFLRGQNIKRGFIALSTVLFVSEDFHRRLAKSAIAPGDVVSVRTGKPGTTAVIPSLLKVANCADLIVMTCGPRLNPEFLCELLNQRLGDKDKIAGATGIAQQHFNIGEARKLEISVPSLTLQNSFTARVAEIRAMEVQQSLGRQRLDALFQSLLHRAFRGEL